MGEKIIAVHIRKNPENGCIEEHDVRLGPGEYEVWNQKTNSYDITPRDRIPEPQIQSIEASRDAVRMEQIEDGLAKTASLGASLK